MSAPHLMLKIKLIQVPFFQSALNPWTYLPEDISKLIHYPSGPGHINQIRLILCPEPLAVLMVVLEILSWNI